MKVLGIGHAVIDEISIMHANGTVEPGDSDAGGPVLVALILLAKLGGDCTFITTLGRDVRGSYIQDLMQASNITLLAQEHADTKVNTILVDEQTGQRTKTQSNITHPSIAGLEPAFLQGFDLIVMDRHEPEAFYEVLRHKRPDTQLVIDPSTELSELTVDMMREADVPIATIGTLARLGQGHTLAEAARELYELLGKPLVVTLGEFGSLTYDGNAVRIIPSYKVSVASDLGAGDVYRGAFAYGQMLGWSLDQCIRYGSAAAAFQCTKLGNASTVPNSHDIKAVINKGSYRHTDTDRLERTFQQMQAELTPITSTTR